MPDFHLATRPKEVFISERPIIWQAYLDLTEFSRTQVVPASVMAVAAFIAAFVTGQVTSAPSALLFILCSVVAGVLFYFVIAIVRAPFIVIGQHHRQLSVLQQKLIEVEARSFNNLPLSPSDGPSQSVPAEMLSAACIEFTNFLVVDRWAAPYGLSGLTDEEPANRREAEDLKFTVMLARFYYKPDRDVLPSLSMKAHLAIADSQGAPLQPRYDGVWDEDSEREYKHFATADTHALIIGLLPKDAKHGLCIYEYGYKSGRFAPKFAQIQGNEFVLQLELIGKRNNVTVLRAPMRFLLTLEPPSLEFLG